LWQPDGKDLNCHFGWHPPRQRAASAAAADSARRDNGLSQASCTGRPPPWSAFRRVVYSVVATHKLRVIGREGGDISR